MFNGKVVLVTGASSGIGAETAVKFAEQGASVVVTGRNIENLNKTAANCNNVSRGKALVVAGDLCSEEFVRELVASTIERFKRLDVLVNNAGFGRLSSIEDTTLDEFDAVFSLNVRASYYLTMLCVPHLIETKGNIVNISSVVSFIAVPKFLAYSMAKSAMDQFTRCCSLDLAAKGVRVNSVNPGVTVTEFFTNAGFPGERDPKEVFEEAARENIPLGRAGRTDEVADAILFLASDKSKYTTGVNHVVDGGGHVTCQKSK